MKYPEIGEDEIAATSRASNCTPEEVALAAWSIAEDLWFISRQIDAGIYTYVGPFCQDNLRRIYEYEFDVPEVIAWLLDVNHRYGKEESSSMEL